MFVLDLLIQLMLVIVKLQKIVLMFNYFVQLLVALSLDNPSFPSIQRYFPRFLPGLLAH